MYFRVISVDNIIERKFRLEFRNGIYEHLALDNSIGSCFSFIWWTRENIFADGGFWKRT